MNEFLLFLGVGFLAQMVDGALGMAYGVISSTVLLAFGVPPAHASAAAHTAEVFTTASSATSHILHKNVDWKMFWRLAPFGVLGGVVGAYILTSIDGNVLKPFVTAYLTVMGLYILYRAFRPPHVVTDHKLAVLAPLGSVGGLVDAVGGGGWGPVVTSTLLGSGSPPRYVVGTVNAAEFFLTVAISSTFLFALLTGHWSDASSIGTHAASVAGLAVGGLLASPLAGFVVRILPRKTLMLLVGCLIMVVAGVQTFQILS